MGEAAIASTARTLESSKLKSSKSIYSPVKNKTLLRIAAVGDIMLGTNFPDNRLAPNDGVDLLKHMTPILENADITSGVLRLLALFASAPVHKLDESLKKVI